MTSRDPKRRQYNAVVKYVSLVLVDQTTDLNVKERAIAK